MLKFHNGSSNLANLVLFFFSQRRKVRKLLRVSRESARIFLFFTLAVGSWLLANFKLRQPKAKSQ